MQNDGVPAISRNGTSERAYRLQDAPLVERGFRLS